MNIPDSTTIDEEGLITKDFVTLSGIKELTVNWINTLPPEGLRSKMDHHRDWNNILTYFCPFFLGTDQEVRR